MEKKRIKKTTVKKDAFNCISAETKNFIDKVKSVTRDMAASKEKSRDFLIKSGIYNKSGHLKKEYR
jgi:hypothetical protein